MKITLEMTYDPESNCAYIALEPRSGGAGVETVVTAVEVEGAHVAIDLNSDRTLAGIEICGASRLLRKSLTHAN